MGEFKKKGMTSLFIAVFLMLFALQINAEEATMPSTGSIDEVLTEEEASVGEEVVEEEQVPEESSKVPSTEELGSEDYSSYED
ncbi:MAG: hypothetical protein OEY33_09575 [Bdellovibrionales bacterium]|jgi:hypothetical protein|nr:hypothetical protein [Bdellovibrionales bacterium]